MHWEGYQVPRVSYLKGLEVEGERQSLCQEGTAAAAVTSKVLVSERWCCLNSIGQS